VKAMSHIADNASGIFGGAIGTVLGSALGMITVHNLIETAVLAFVGAVIGFFTNKGLKWITKKMS